MKKGLASKLVALVIAASPLIAGALATPANAAGVEVYRTDSQGNKTGTVKSVGNTGSTAFCAGTGVGAVRYGVKVCYL